MDHIIKNIMLWKPLKFVNILEIEEIVIYEKIKILNFEISLKIDFWICKNWMAING